LFHAGRAARVQYGGAAIPRGPHSENRAALSGAALALLLLATPAVGQPTGLAPYRYATPYGASPLDQEKARVYQDQLRHDVPREPPPDATAAARERELRQELDRVDRLLERPPPPAAAVSEKRAPDLGPVTASGGHPQPTPAEIKEKQRQQRLEAPPPAPMKPIYDLFGERLQ
jgi:hypothetical protein